jgi:hypothetical protein
MNVIRRLTAIAAAMLFGMANSATTEAVLVEATRLPAYATPHEEAGVAHLPLTTVGVTPGQTLRINIVNSPDPNSLEAPTSTTVEMCFHDSNGDLILDRSRRPVQKTATIDPHHGDSLELNGNLVASPGSRVVIIPCVRILSINRGTLAVPTVELYNNLLKTTLVLTPGTARGFDPQPDPPFAPEVAFGLVGITPGVTARLYVNNAENPTGSDPPEPVTVEMEFHDANGNGFGDRAGRTTRKIVTLNPNQVDYLELSGNDVAAPGARVGIIPCVKILRGSPGSLVVPTFEMYLNFTQQTLLLGNFVSDPHTTTAPTALRNEGKTAR